MLKRSVFLMMLLLGLVVVLGGCSSDEEPPPPPPPVEEPPVEEPAPTEPEVTFDSLAINFDYDQYMLTEEAKSNLQVKADYLKAHPEMRVQIEGHCDERGSNQYNLALGDKRANATKEHLVSLGVSADQLSTISYGEERPVDHANTEESWAKNRRSEFITQ